MALTLPILINLIPRGRDPFGQRRGLGPLARWDFESANRGLPVTLRRIKSKPKMAERSPDTFLEGVKYGLEKLGKANITLKPKQEEILKIIALTQKDLLAVLPTGYGKSLIYQIMPPLMDYMDSGQRPAQKKSIVLVVSPLNALIRDQVTKLKQSGLKACILKGDHVEGEEEERKEQEGLAFSAIENLKEFQLIFAHPEALVGNKNVIKLLKTSEFKNRMKAIVVDEAHLVVDW